MFVNNYQLFYLLTGYQLYTSTDKLSLGQHLLFYLFIPTAMPLHTKITMDDDMKSVVHTETIIKCDTINIGLESFVNNRLIPFHIELFL